MYAAQQHPDTATLPLLALAGNCGYAVNDGRVVVSVAEIANHRDSGNISGTVAVELWALKQKYAGGSFTGQALAGTSIGALSGGHFLADCRYDLVFQEPPAGTWLLTLMVREWTDAGYITRDYVNFPVPYVIGGKPTAVCRVADNVVKPRVADDVENATQGTPAAPAAPAAEPAERTGGKPQAHAAVSLNQSSLKDIAAVKGISKKVAQNLVAARPFQSFDEVLKVKGIGAALLEKVRKFITL
jgi:DNA uptake protein ComE-like DNA-binding protein